VARYTLKTFYGEREIERFDHRSAQRLQEILDHPRHHRAGQTGPFGEPMKHPDRFEIFDSQMEKLFNGNIGEALQFTRTLR
jgi:hypothetical protein